MADLRVGSPTSTPLALPSLPPLPRTEGTDGDEGFGPTLVRALDNVSRLQLEARDATLALATGKPVSMTETVVAVEKANIAFQFALQVRNKLLEAYQEIMRMQV